MLENGVKMESEKKKGFQFSILVGKKHYERANNNIYNIN